MTGDSNKSRALHNSQQTMRRRRNSCEQMVITADSCVRRRSSCAGMVLTAAAAVALILPGAQSAPAAASPSAFSRQLMSGRQLAADDRWRQYLEQLEYQGELIYAVPIGCTSTGSSPLPMLLFMLMQQWFVFMQSTFHGCQKLDRTFVSSTSKNYCHRYLSKTALEAHVTES